MKKNFVISILLAVLSLGYAHGASADRLPNVKGSDLTWSGGGNAPGVNQTADAINKTRDQVNTNTNDITQIKKALAALCSAMNSGNSH